MDSLYGHMHAIFWRKKLMQFYSILYMFKFASYVIYIVTEIQPKVVVNIHVRYCLVKEPNILYAFVQKEYSNEINK
jgi:hypothetical protein